ncbi:MAG: hypothetical protein GC152_10265 [Alphaproteobacteria bacterium]|nr:hypothetical protein [Alphaproteobacteria bacterium]
MRQPRNLERQPSAWAARSNSMVLEWRNRAVDAATIFGALVAGGAALATLALVAPIAVAAFGLAGAAPSRAGRAGWRTISHA